MHQPARLMFAALLAAAAASALAHDGPTAWHAEQHATARIGLAEQALSDRYTAIWSSLDAAQKARFSARERAWLNEGRQREKQACIASNAARTAAVSKSCEAEVLERHLRALSAHQRVASTD